MPPAALGRLTTPGVLQPTNCTVQLAHTLHGGVSSTKRCYTSEGHEDSKGKLMT